MAELFNEEQQKVFNEKLAEKQEQWKRKFEGYLSPDDFKAQTADLNKQINDLTKALDDANKQIETTNNSIAEKDAAIKNYEARSVKTRVAHEVGLSYDAIDFLRGDDEDTIRKSAESLKSLVGTKVPPAPSNEPHVGEVDKSREAAKNLLKGLNNK